MRAFRSEALAWALMELALMLAAAAVAVLFVHGILSVAKFSALNEVAPGIGPLWAAAMILVAVAAQLVQRRYGLRTAASRAGVALLAGVATGLVTGPLTAGLRGTSQPLNTILGGDMAFRTEYVTRFDATWHLQDYTFRGLHAFYPPAWFWVAGRTAHLLGLHQPWHIVKPFTIFTVGAALFVAYLMWRTVLSPAGALCAAIGSSLVLGWQMGPTVFATAAWYEPYSCFVAITGAAWVAATLSAVRIPRARLRLLVLGLVGAGLALCYYLLFIILAVVLIVLVAIPAAGRREALGRVAALFAGIALLTAVFWVPLIGALVHGAASQGQFVRPDFLHVFIGIGRPVALTLLALVAVVAVAFTITSIASQAVAGVLAGTVAYQFVSVATLVFASNQLQPHRAVTMLWATLGAAVPVALEGFRADGTLGRLLQPPLPRMLGVAAALVAIPTVFVIGSDQGSDLASGPFARAAHGTVALANTNAISSFITSTTGKKPQQLTVLAGDHTLQVIEPYYGFLPLRARYAHPEAHLAQRIAVLRAAARCPTPTCTTHALERSRFGRIDALVLARAPTGLRIETEEDLFPRSRPIQILFRRGSFANGDWIRRDFRGYTVLVLRPGARVV